jgi:hypothetical protein
VRWRGGGGCRDFGRLDNDKNNQLGLPFQAAAHRHPRGELGVLGCAHK